jgi:hypothetical protein
MDRVERAKLAILDLTVEDASVARLTGRSGFTFGCEVVATKEGYFSFADAVANLGLRAELHFGDKIVASKSEPVYLYEITIYVPEDWREPK